MALIVISGGGRVVRGTDIDGAEANLVCFVARSQCGGAGAPAPRSAHENRAGQGVRSTLSTSACHSASRTKGF
jgi:hypothetical protein